MNQEDPKTQQDPASGSDTIPLVVTEQNKADVVERQETPQNKAENGIGKLDFCVYDLVIGPSMTDATPGSQLESQDREGRKSKSNSEDDDDDDGDVDEEDNSNDGSPKDDDSTKNNQVSLKIPEQENKFRSSSEESQGNKKPLMISRDLSPLSPGKKRHLGAKRVTGSASGSECSPEILERRKKFSGFKLKGTEDQTFGVAAQSHKEGLKGLVNCSEQDIKPIVSEFREKDYIPANPILPKQAHLEQKKPPSCPIKDIQFIQLQKFKRFKEQRLAKMGDGYDQVGKKNMMRENRMKRIQHEEKKKTDSMRRGIEEDEKETKMDEYTHIIQNIVFARDPKIFDTKNGYVNQRAAFQHENMLDIKTLIRQNEERAQGGERNIGSYRPPPPKRIIKTKQQIDHDRELEAKARYKLRENDDGEIDRSDKTLLFESRFESGNLYLAQKVSDHEYNLMMQNDINTSGHTQWFFFQVKNTRKNMNVQFNIMNFTKPDSLFNYGMKVSVYSEKMAKVNEDSSEETTGLKVGSAQEEGQGWFKGGERVSYYANGIKKDVTFTSRGYYTASFNYKFTHDDDVVYFAYCFPYSYTDLMNDIFEIESDPERRKICSRKTLCKTLAGVDCDILTITEKGDFESMQAKKAIILSARVHPGEVVGSWMMRGVLLYLTDPDNAEAKMLREKFIFKVIPMLNPDGVINGNYRCSLAGCDLNRRWKTPSKTLHPTIYYTKKLIKDLHNERGVTLYCDLHGHSRKQNVFMYGCNNKMKPEECRVFPLILSKLSQFFHFGSCRFGVQKSKESTARVSLYKELKTCPNIFTMESTFSGIDMGERKGQHMTTFDFEQMGTDLCRALLIYDNIFIPPELEHLYGTKDDGKQPDMSKIFEQELVQNKKLIAAGDGDSSGGSDSEPSEDNLPVDEVAKVVPIVDKQQKIQLAKIIKRKAQEEKDIEKKKLEKKSLPPKEDISPTRSPIPRQRSPVKKPAQEIIQVKPVEEKKETTKKKPEMKDACTQTERSDYQRIKKQQQQARMMAEMKEQQARMRSNAQNTFKSPNNLVDGQIIKKTPQSQTAKREQTGNFNLSAQQQKPQPNNQNPERHLQDMRDPKKYQLSKDKYSLFQVQNFNPQNGPAASPTPPGGQQFVTSPKIGVNNIESNRNNIHQQQLQQQQQSINPNQQLNMKNGNNKNMVLQMSQINSGIVSNGNNQVNYNSRPNQQLMIQNNQKLQNQTQRNAPQQNQNSNQKKIQQFRQGPPIKKQDGNLMLDLVDRSANQNAAQSQSSVNSTQQQSQNLRGPSSTMSKAGEQILQKQSNFQSPKKSNTNNSQSGASKHDLRFQIQTITSNHFGAIHMGGGMSFMKDSILNNVQKGQFGGQQQVMMSPQPPQRRITNNNLTPGTLGSGASVPTVTVNQSLIQSQVKERGGTGNQNSEPNSAAPWPNDPTLKSQDFISKRNSQQRRLHNQSQLEQNASRNLNEMENIKLFTGQSQNNGPTQAVHNTPLQLQKVPNTQEVTKSFDKRDRKYNLDPANKSSPVVGGRVRAESLTYSNRHQQKAQLPEVQYNGYTKQQTFNYNQASSPLAARQFKGLQDSNQTTPRKNHIKNLESSIEIVSAGTVGPISHFQPSNNNQIIRTRDGQRNVGPFVPGTSNLQTVPQNNQNQMIWYGNQSSKTSSVQQSINNQQKTSASYHKKHASQIISSNNPPNGGNSGSRVPSQPISAERKIKVEGRGSKRNSQANFVIQSAQIKNHILMIDPQSSYNLNSNQSSPGKVARPQNAHNNNVQHNNRNVYRMKINAKNGYSTSPKDI